MCIRDRRKSLRIASGIIKFIFLFGFCFVILYPVATMILKTFMDKRDLIDNSVIYIPRHFTLENIKAAAMTLNYGKSLMNTVVISMSTTCLLYTSRTAVCILWTPDKTGSSCWTRNTALSGKSPALPTRARRRLFLLPRGFL